ncbi:hypothetical protein TNCT_212961 [Trichonephila clavata]|uniref:Uncharacterized protein n=1 Tax=Trichonephila clavata TaxID=2740835 RepID=A0A8X6HCY4_TRICU|nr:hypothetical protein TNCT_212961 [Trichonephila clavata]
MLNLLPFTLYVNKCAFSILGAVSAIDFHQLPHYPRSISFLPASVTWGSRLPKNRLVHKGGTRAHWCRWSAENVGNAELRCFDSVFSGVATRGRLWAFILFGESLVPNGTV